MCYLRYWYLCVWVICDVQLMYLFCTVRGWIRDVTFSWMIGAFLSEEIAGTTFTFIASCSWAASVSTEWCINPRPSCLSTNLMEIMFILFVLMLYTLKLHWNFPPIEVKLRRSTARARPNRVREGITRGAIWRSIESLDLFGYRSRNFWDGMIHQHICIVYMIFRVFNGISCLKLPYILQIDACKSTKRSIYKSTGWVAGCLIKPMSFFDPLNVRTGHAGYPRVYCHDSGSGCRRSRNSSLVELMVSMAGPTLRTGNGCS